jgi:predicted outer membrane protein
MEMGLPAPDGLNTPSKLEAPLRKFLVTVGICTAFALSGQAFAAPDAKTFVADAITANNGLVKMGNVGQAKGRTTTQTFAIRMQRDFNHANDELVALAGTLGVTPPDALPADVQAQAVSLSHTGDDDFDKAYGTYLVKLLEAQVAEYQSVADAKSGAASELAAAQLPVLQKTLDGAKRVAR